MPLCTQLDCDNMNQQTHAHDETEDSFQDPWDVIGDQETGAARVLTQMQRHAPVQIEQQMPCFGGASILVEAGIHDHARLHFAVAFILSQSY